MNFRFPILTTAACLGTLLLGASCSREAVLPADTLAVIGERIITSQDVAAEAARREAAGLARLEPSVLLDRMLMREAMLVKARAQGLEADPEIQRAMERVLISALRERELVQLLDSSDISEATLQEVYAERIGEFTKPALTRVAMLYVARDKTVSAEKLLALRARATEAKQAADQWVASSDFSAKQSFGELSVRYSDDAVGRYRGGDLGWVSAQAAPATLPPEAFARALELPLGQPSEVLEFDSGFYVVMRTDERASVTKPFSTVRPQLKKQQLLGRRKTLEADYYEATLQAAEPQIFTERIAALEPLPEQDASPAQLTLRPDFK